ncbi:hypothetical protein CAEBREN_12451 [Caenorhabditis brenneri]|uniref:Uncharacterized protein n=1 Tax=Caenorhabditis brenneri TaxID=135651 RepID=G0PHI1_CAEBE|nr:hypothetical protein CAEBREN_12451 [Caenorhabditis brenneri]
MSSSISKPNFAHCLPCVKSDAVEALAVGEEDCGNVAFDGGGSVSRLGFQEELMEAESCPDGLFETAGEVPGGASLNLKLSISGLQVWVFMCRAVL